MIISSSSIMRVPVAVSGDCFRASRSRSGNPRDAGARYRDTKSGSGRRPSRPYVSDGSYGSGSGTMVVVDVVDGEMTTTMPPLMPPTRISSPDNAMRVPDPRASDADHRSIARTSSLTRVVVPVLYQALLSLLSSVVLLSSPLVLVLMMHTKDAFPRYCYDTVDDFARSLCFLI